MGDDAAEPFFRGLFGELRRARALVPVAVILSLGVTLFESSRIRRIRGAPKVRRWCLDSVIITFSSDCIHSTAHKPYTCGCPECVRHVESMFGGVLLPKLLEKSA